MSKTKINVVGIGCDFQNEADESRKLAIENLSGGEKDRISWMTKFMVHNKAFKYTSSNKSEKEKQNLLNKLNNNYIQYRKNWKNQPIQSFKIIFMEKNFREQNNNPLCFDIEVASICDLACGFCYRQYVSTPDKIMKRNLHLN